MIKKNVHWKIRIAGWGTLYAIGHKKQADEWCEAKCEWEGGGGKVIAATELEKKQHKFEQLDELIYFNSTPCPSE